MNKNNDVKISKKKPTYKISNNLDQYLSAYKRIQRIPIEYSDLLRYVGSIKVTDEKDVDTLWQRVFFNDSEGIEIENNLKIVYNLLYSDGSNDSIDFLVVDAIDYCTFGNSNPFRIKIRNSLNDNFTYYYVKTADSSRVYGLEFEHITSPHNLNFIVYNKTLIEEHITGIPGDDFYKNYLSKCSKSEQSQIAKEFVKFSERCMIRLLGDMRAYNYVIIPTHDFDQVVYKIRAIDFDQQSYEGNFSVYRPQLYKENRPIIELIKERLINSSIDQYKIEERAIIVKRILGSKERIKSLIDSMKNDIVSTNENVQKLARQIYHLTQDNRFKFSKSMGDIMESSIDYMINNYENHSMLGTN